jgi:hypothetical protein
MLILVDGPDRQSDFKREEDCAMKSAAKCVSFVLLGAGLCAPAAIVARAASQDEHRQEENRRNDEHRNDEHRNRRVYDRAHKDYHNWDDNEDRTYRQYYSEQHRDYRDYDKLNRRQQNEYWNWRHNHSDGEERHEDRH